MSNEKKDEISEIKKDSEKIDQENADQENVEKEKSKKEFPIVETAQDGDLIFYKITTEEKQISLYMDKDEKKQQQYKEIDVKNNAVICELEYLNDELHGDCKYYDKSGRLIQEIKYTRNNVLHLKTYDKNKLTSDMQYDVFDGESKLHGVCKLFKDGKEISILSYKEGKLCGPAKFFKDNLMTAEINYDDDQFHGESKMFWPGSESVAQINQYHEGKKHGNCKSFYQNGALLEDSEYENDVEKEKKMFIIKDDELIEQQLFSNGKLVQKIKMK